MVQNQDMTEPPRSRGRPRKNEPLDQTKETSDKLEKIILAVDNEQDKKVESLRVEKLEKRGRPRKNPVDEEALSGGKSTESRSRGRPRKIVQAAVVVKGKRGRPKKALKVEHDSDDLIEQGILVESKIPLKIGKPKKDSTIDQDKEVLSTNEDGEHEQVDELEQLDEVKEPPRKRGRPRKSPELEENEEKDEDEQVDELESTNGVKAPRKRGRPRKDPVSDQSQEKESLANNGDNVHCTPPKRGRPKKYTNKEIDINAPLKRGRPRKHSKKKQASSEENSVHGSEETQRSEEPTTNSVAEKNQVGEEPVNEAKDVKEKENKTSKKRGRPRKNIAREEYSQPKKRGRPRTYPEHRHSVQEVQSDSEDLTKDAHEEFAKEKVVKRRGRPRKHSIEIDYVPKKREGSNEIKPPAKRGRPRKYQVEKLDG
ncbi:hypothetical protein G6F56_004146 [Rhizopus delemar]|uniref:Uncharacterized protein n=1 Tax=Rhizopus stolonifer TaxID=4846 RepID=A0A367KTV0_RHIST|nr:hypothetical protein G6F56_004146 [Rhizopus delemar]RCI05567.1 hypothetical protein CU098_012994 [Rhizopus stolonifer]